MMFKILYGHYFIKQSLFYLYILVLSKYLMKIKFLNFSFKKYDMSFTLKRYDMSFTLKSIYYYIMQC